MDGATGSEGCAQGYGKPIAGTISGNGDGEGDSNGRCGCCDGGEEPFSCSSFDVPHINRKNKVDSGEIYTK